MAPAMGLEVKVIFFPGRLAVDLGRDAMPQLCDVRGQESGVEVALWVCPGREDAGDEGADCVILQVGVFKLALPVLRVACQVGKGGEVDSLCRLPMDGYIVADPVEEVDAEALVCESHWIRARSVVSGDQFDFINDSPVPHELPVDCDVVVEAAVSETHVDEGESEGEGRTGDGAGNGDAGHCWGGKGSHGCRCLWDGRKTQNGTMASAGQIPKVPT